MELVRKIAKIIFLIVLIAIAVIGYIIMFLYDIIFNKKESDDLKEKITTMVKKIKDTKQHTEKNHAVPNEPSVKIKEQEKKTTNNEFFKDYELENIIKEVYENKTKLKIEMFSYQHKEEYKEINKIIKPIVKELSMIQNIKKNSDLKLVIEYVFEEEFKKNNNFIAEEYIKSEEKIKERENNRIKPLTINKNEVFHNIQNNKINQLTIEEKLILIDNYQNERIENSNDLNTEPSIVNITEVLSEIENLEDIAVKDKNKSNEEKNTSKEEKNVKNQKDKINEKTEKIINKEEEIEKSDNLIEKELIQKENLQENKKQKDEKIIENLESVNNNFDTEISVVNKRVENIVNVFYNETIKEKIEERDYAHIEEKIIELENILYEFNLSKYNDLSKEDKEKISYIKNQIKDIKISIVESAKNDYKNFNQFLSKTITLDDKLLLIEQLRKQEQENKDNLIENGLEKVSDLDRHNNNEVKKKTKHLIKNNLKSILNINGGFLSFIPLIKNRYFSSFSKTLMINRKLKFTGNIINKVDSNEYYDLNKVEYTIDSLEENVRLNKENMEYAEAINDNVNINYPELANDLEYKIYMSMIRASIHKKNEKLNKKYKYLEKTKKKGYARIKK